MSLLQVVVLDEDVMPACATLVEQKVVHLVDRAIVAPALREGTPTYFASAHAELERLQDQLQVLAVWMAEYPVERLPETMAPKIDPNTVAEELSPEISAAIDELQQLREQRDTSNKRVNDLTRISDALQSLETAGITYREMARFQYFAFFTGTMPLRFIPALRRSLHQVSFHIELRNLGEDEVSVLVLCPKDVANPVRSTLRSLYFSEVQVPDQYQGDPRDALDMLEVEMWQAREEVAAVNGRIRQCCDRVAPQLHRWYRVVRANLRVLDSMQLFGKTARTTFINGWVPTRRVEHVTRALKDALADRVLVEASTPDADAGLARELMDSGRVLVPTKFRHPFFLKPFEGLVTTYGYPEYNGVDPTFFVAATFLIMFGIMFGDVGHGLVLAAIGLFVARSKLFAEFAQAGWLLFSAGVSATLFGFMFGSLFGLEGIIPAIWIIPFQQVTKILIAAIMLGIGIITLGIILNVVQAYAQRNFKEALFGQWGLVSGSFYWMALGVFYITLVARHEVPFGLVIIVLLAPIVLVVLGDLFYARLFGGAHTDEVHDDAEHSFAEVIFKPVEITLGFVTHTVSFVRVGAFGLNHAALMMVVYVLAEMGGGLTGPNATFSSQASYIFSAIVGNIFVMMLEGLVVFIQCLRLEYYEFFSKFFSGEGVRYEPLQVEDL